MRCVSALASLLGAAALVSSQEKPKTGDEAVSRLGIVLRLKAYPQATPKQALESVITAADKGEFGYLVAHLLDPAFVDARLGDRARQFEPAVEADLARLREYQQLNLDKIPREARIPTDPAAFRDRVAADARAAAFRQVVRDVQDKLTDDPEVLKDLRRFYRQGTFPDPAAPGDTAKVGLPDVKDRAVFLRKRGERWYVENRQTDEKVAEPKKE